MNQPMIIRIEESDITKDVNINHVTMVYYYTKHNPPKAVIYYENNSYSYETVIGDEAVKQLQNVFNSNLKKVIISDGKTENAVISFTDRRKLNTGEGNRK